jgi:acyl-CoA synthetase (AMP-forming)/AMP-acid ligase II
VIGLPYEKWGERIAAVLQIRPGRAVTPDVVKAFVKERIGSVKTPKQIEIWPDLPRAKVGKVLKHEVKRQLVGESTSGDLPR